MNITLPRLLEAMKKLRGQPNDDMSRQRMRVFSNVVCNEANNPPDVIDRCWLIVDWFEPGISPLRLTMKPGPDSMFPPGFVIEIEEAPTGTKT